MPNSLVRLTSRTERRSSSFAPLIWFRSDQDKSRALGEPFRMRASCGCSFHSASPTTTTRVRQWKTTLEHSWVQDQDHLAGQPLVDELLRFSRAIGPSVSGRGCPTGGKEFRTGVYPGTSLPIRTRPGPLTAG